MKAVTAFRAEHDQYMKKFWEEKQTCFISQTVPSKDFQTALQSMKNIVFGDGKRIRPLFVHNLYTQMNGKNAAIWKVAVAVEWFHAFALIHDDIMDKSTKRRGHDTLHVAIANQTSHANNVDHYAMSQSLLLGDLLFSWAVELFHQGIQELHSENSATTQYFFRMIDEVTVGQFEDTRVSTIDQPSYEDVLKKTRLKTAAYTFVRPMHIGLSAAGVTDTQLFDWCEQYGNILGELFQIQDDMLDVLGVEGKEPLQDVRDGIPTVMTEYIFSQTTEEQQAQFLQYFGKNVAQEKNEELKDFFVTCGAVNHAKEIVQTKEAAARSMMNTIPKELDGPFFTNILDLLVARTA